MAFLNKEDDEDPAIRKTLGRSNDWIVERDRLISLWARASSWTLEEGIALAYNEDPAKAIRTIDSALGETALVVPDPGDHHLQLAKRARWDGQLSMPITPMKFMSWAENVGLKFDSAWRMAAIPDGSVVEPISPKEIALTGVGEGTLSQQNSEHLHDDDDINAKAKASLLRLVIGMAVGGYSYNPADTRSDVTKEISDDLDRVGVSLKRDTILKWLRQGAELLPQDTSVDESNR
ncbi:hypothetical protein [Minwuia sp.]|uniref:hypothetical protein n=1 Tax=Minwuia sp. TaxID=2493630 RepID=UPI003A948DCC